MKLNALFLGFSTWYTSYGIHGWGYLDWEGLLHTKLPIVVPLEKPGLLSCVLKEKVPNTDCLLVCIKTLLYLKDKVIQHCGPVIVVWWSGSRNIWSVVLASTKPGHRWCGSYTATHSLYFRKLFTVVLINIDSGILQCSHKLLISATASTISLASACRLRVSPSKCWRQFAVITRALTNSFVVMASKSVLASVTESRDHLLLPSD